MTFHQAVHHFFNTFSRSFVLIIIYYQLGAPTTRPGDDLAPPFEEAWDLI